MRAGIFVFLLTIHSIPVFATTKVYLSVKDQPSFDQWYAARKQETTWSNLDQQAQGVWNFLVEQTKQVDDYLTQYLKDGGFEVVKSAQDKWDFAVKVEALNLDFDEFHRVEGYVSTKGEGAEKNHLMNATPPIKDDNTGRDDTEKVCDIFVKKFSMWVEIQNNKHYADYQSRMRQLRRQGNAKKG